MSYVFNPIYIKENPLLFYIFIILMILIMIMTIYFVYKELRNNK